jgi:hypothetical protein
LILGRMARTRSLEAQPRACIAYINSAFQAMA